MPKPGLCLTPGDPAGVGPEITAKFLVDHAPTLPDVTFHVIGDIDSLAASARLLQKPLPQTPQVHYHPITATSTDVLVYQALETAVAMIAQHKADALVTGPIAKITLPDLTLSASGHTEILEHLSHCFFPNQSAKAEMLFLYQRLRLLLLTRHVPLNEVSTQLRPETVRPPLEILQTFLTQTLALHQPKVAVLGVNPHAGEIGGHEEFDILKPVMAQVNAKNRMHLEGPFAADAFFRGFKMDHFPYAAVVAPYHDQGLIPMKLIAGFKAVNVTIGLPFIRTSVSHGTALDIAGKGIASEESLCEAVLTALALVKAEQKKFATPLSFPH